MEMMIQTLILNISCWLLDYVIIVQWIKMYKEFKQDIYDWKYSI